MMMMMMTPLERRVHVCSGNKFSGACRPNARERHGACLWAGGVAQKSQEGHANDPSAEGHFWREKAC